MIASKSAILRYTKTPLVFAACSGVMYGGSPALEPVAKMHLSYLNICPLDVWTRCSSCEREVTVSPRKYLKLSGCCSAYQDGGFRYRFSIYEFTFQNGFKERKIMTHIAMFKIVS